MRRLAAILVVLILAAGNAVALASAARASMPNECPHHAGCMHHSVFTCCATDGPAQADPMAATTPARIDHLAPALTSGQSVAVAPDVVTLSFAPVVRPHGYPPGDLLTRLTTLLI
jgi:hypothetical protein